MISDEINLTTCVFLWCISLIFILVNEHQSRSSSGLLVGYAFSCSMMYLSGAVVNIIPWYDLSSNIMGSYRDINNSLFYTRLGFSYCLFGFISTIIGSKFTHLFFKPPTNISNRPINERTAFNIVGIGGIMFFIILPSIGHFPSFHAVFSLGSTVMLTGICILFYNSLLRKRGLFNIRQIPIFLSVPVYYLVFHSNTYYAAIWSLQIAAFIYLRSKSRLIVILVAIITLYVVASIYVTYKSGRAEMRSITWNTNADRITFSQKLSATMVLLSKYHLFNIFDANDLSLVDGRMNENITLGHVVYNFKKGYTHHENGKTIIDAITAVVPRVIWPKKPISQGDDSLVRKHSGMKLVKTSKYATGTITEFYINFGTPGIFVGMFIIGVCLRVTDTVSFNYLKNHNISGFLCWFIPGWSFVNTAQTITGIFSLVAASVFLSITIMVVNYYFIRNKSDRYNLIPNNEHKSYET